MLRLAIIVLLALGVSAPVASADSLVEWVRIQRIAESEGPSAALSAIDRATAGLPHDSALLFQLLELSFAAGGPGLVESTWDSIRVAVPSAVDDAMLRALVLQEEGDEAAADSLTAAALAAHPPESLAHLMALQLRTRYGLRINVPIDRDTADAHVTALGSHPLLAAGDGGGSDEGGSANRATTGGEGPAADEAWAADAAWAARYFQLNAELLRASLEVRLRGIEAGAEVEAVMRAARGEGYPSLPLRFTTILGFEYIRAGGAAAAMPLLETNLETARRLGHAPGEYATLHLMAWAEEILSRVDLSLAHYTESARLARACGDRRILAWASVGIGWMSWVVGDVNRALSALVEARDLMEAMNELRGLSLSLNNLGIVQQDLGRPDLAIETYARVLELAEAGGNRGYVHWALNNIASLYLEQRKLDEAVDYYQRSLEVSRELGDPDQESAVLGNLALASYSLGRVEQAETFFQQALSVADQLEVNRPTRLAYILSNWGSELIRQGEYEKAEPLLREALKRAQESGETLVDAMTRFALGRCLYNLDQGDEALVQLQRADSLLTLRSDTLLRPEVLISLAENHRGAGRMGESLAAAADCLQLTRDRADAYSEGFCLIELAWTQVEAGQLDEARATIELALETSLEAQKNPLRADASSFYRVAYRSLAAYVDIHELAGIHDLDDARAVHAFEQLQRLKGRSLLERIQAGQRAIAPQIPKELEEAERQARFDAMGTRRRLEEGGLEDAARDSLRLVLAEQETAYLTVRERIQGSDARYERASEQRPVTLAQLREELLDRDGDDLLILDFLLVPSHHEHRRFVGYLFALDRDRLVIHPLPPLSKLAPRLELFIALVQQRPSGPADEAAVRASGTLLLEQLTGPLAHELDRYRRVVVVPDGPLHLLPFAALSMRDGDSGDRSYLAQKLAMSTVPSLSVFRDLSEQARNDFQAATDLAVWASPDATGSARGDRGRGSVGTAEAEALLHGFSGSTRFDAEATDASPLSQLRASPLMGQSRILHFIAHGEFDDAQPWRTGLYLAGGPGAAGTGDDGSRLEMADVYYLDFHSQLVTLAACETARGKVIAGEGMQGFASALFGSGAESVLATLWSIDDASTSVFMPRFYRLLADGHSKAEALALAQSSFIDDDEAWSHPFYWGAYVLLGDGESTVGLRRRGPARSVWFAVLAVSVLMTAIVLARRRPVSRSRGSGA